MRDRDARAREIMRQIGAVLIKDWDPLGVNHIPEAQDEYGSYVGPIYRLWLPGPARVRSRSTFVRLSTGKWAWVVPPRNFSCQSLRNSSRWRLLSKMARLPNPRLQRTRSAPLRSPLSRKPFGARPALS